MSDEERGLGGKIAITVLVVILFSPGLVIEPGPLSEGLALTILAGVWGIPLLGGDE